MPANRTAPTCLVCRSDNTHWWADATDAEYFTTTDTFAYFRCETCGVLFIDPVPRERLAEIYPKSYYSFASPANSVVQRFKRKLDQRLFRRVLRQLPGNSLNLLDVGGGAGWELNWIRELDQRIQFTQVVDLDPAAEAIARRNGHEYFCGRAETFSSNRRFDLILLFNLIEHVEDPHLLLARMCDLLSPGGQILLKTPNTDSLDARLFRHANWAGYHCPRHWALFTKESFVALAHRVGLSVADFRYTQGAPFWTASVLYKLHVLGIARLDKNRPVWYHPLFGPISALFATFDFARMPFSKPSQMFVTLKL